VRFEGSLLTAPLMVMACLYLLCWDYDKLKFILPFNYNALPKQEITNNKFPFLFFAGAFTTIVLYVMTITHVYDLMPRNTLNDCQRQCNDKENPGACKIFCECVHNQGMPLNKALDNYHSALKRK